MSSYVSNLEPTKFNTPQSAYSEETERAVQKTTERFQSAVKAGEDLTKLFHETLANLGEARRAIARKYAGPDGKYSQTSPEDFGARRDLMFRGPNVLTPLHGPYQKHNENLLVVFKRYLSEMKHTENGFTETKLKVNFPPCLGKDSSLEFFIMNETNKKEWLLEFNLKKLCELCEVAPPKTPEESEACFRSIYSNKETMGKLKQVAPEEYKKIKLRQAIFEVKKNHRVAATDFVLVTARIQLGDKMCALSQYLAWMHRDLKNDPVETMNSVITIIHEDPFLIEPMLNEISHTFKEALECKEVPLLKQKVALLQYQLAHTMPFIRGSAAVAEWLEEAIYRSHGFQIIYLKPKGTVNLEALTSSLPQFMENYESMIDLRSLPNQVAVTALDGKSVEKEKQKGDREEKKDPKTEPKAGAVIAEMVGRMVPDEVGPSEK